MPRIGKKKAAQPIQGQRFMPTSKQNGGIPHRAVEGKPRHPWEYMCHPFKWDWTEERGFYPKLGRFHHMPGCGNVSEGDTTMGQATLSKKGWQVIGWADPRLEDFQYYVTTHKLTNGGTVYVSIFEHPEVLGNQVFWKTDKEEYTRFVKHLVDSGIVPKIHPQVKESMLRKQEAVVTKLENDLMATPGNRMIEVRLNAQVRRLAMMRGDDADTAVAAAERFAKEMKGE